MPDSPPALSAAELSRYSRHLLLEEIGVDGQQRLAAARVLVVGAGGLGSPAALYLAAAGVGTLGIADLDRVELHNLQRQLLHDTAAVGTAKISSAAQRLHALNPHVHVVTFPDGITAANAREIFTNFDVIVDGTDNFSARYVNNDAAFHTQKPLVFGSVFKFEGQVSVFAPARGGPCYRCLFPAPPAAGSVPGCGEAGVLGAVCGVIGSLQALEAIKLITAIGEPLVGQLLTYEALTQRFQTLHLAPDPGCPLCGEHPRPVSGSAPPATALPSLPRSPVNDEAYPLELSVGEAHRCLQNSPERTTLIDVREPWETEVCRVAGAEFIPMRQIPEHLATLARDRHLLIMCHHGGRSRSVTDYLRARGFAAVSNISGGIAAWADQIDPAMPRY